MTEKLLTWMLSLNTNKQTNKQLLRGTRSNFEFFMSFFDEIPLSIQNSSRWDATFCGVTSGAILFAYVP